MAGARRLPCGRALRRSQRAGCRRVLNGGRSRMVGGGEWESGRNREPLPCAVSGARLASAHGAAGHREVRGCPRAHFCSSDAVPCGKEMLLESAAEGMVPSACHVPAAARLAVGRIIRVWTAGRELRIDGPQKRAVRALSTAGSDRAPRNPESRLLNRRTRMSRCRLAGQP